MLSGCSDSHATKPLVAIIIINWNGLNDTIKCIDSALKLSYQNFRIVVVDNASEINEAEALKKIYNVLIHTLRTSVNKGYSAGINYGIRYVLSRMPDTKYFLISNNDVVFKQDFLERIVEFMEINPYAGIAAGKIMLMGTRNILFSVGQKWNLKTGFVKNTGFYEKNSKKHLKICEIDFVPGATFIVAKKVIEKIGLFDEEYFLYFEEPDYCLRAKRAGYKTFLVPEAISYHKSGASTKKVSLFAYYHSQKSKLRFIIKNIDSIYLPSALFLNISYSLVNSFLSSIRQKNFKLILYTIKATYETLLNAKSIRSHSTKPMR